MHSFRYTLAAYLAIFSLAFPQSLFAATITNTACTDDFDNGNYNYGAADMECSSDQIQLNGTGTSNGSGEYTSEIFDAESSVTWQTIAWSPQQPYGKHVIADSGYSEGNLDDTGLVLNMYFDESSWDGTADEVNDESGNANHGVRVGNADTVAAGKLDRAGTFDGSGDYVQVADDDTLDLTSALTLSVWIKTTVTNNGILSKGPYNSSSNGDYAISIKNTTDNASCIINGSAAIARGTTRVDDGEWYHIVCTYDSTAGGNDELKVYVNGVQEGSEDYSGSINTNSDPLRIGTYYSGTYVFDGELDELSIWNRALSAAEVEDLFLRSANRIKYQVRVCDDAACSGEDFIGPDGTTATFYTERTSALSAGKPSKTLTNLQNSGEGQYFQYYAKFETDDSSFTPELLDLTITHSGGGAEPVPEFSDMMYMMTLGICIWFVYRKINDQGFRYA